MTKFIYLVLFLSTVPLANWMIGNVGITCVPNGPCLIPVAPNLMAPSGVLLIGVSLVLRDIVHEYFGPLTAIIAILVGAFLSSLVAPTSLVVASGVAFLLSELADMAVYTPLRKKRLIMAVFASGVVGSVVDSAVFLWIAFGSLDYLTGQVVGKVWMTILAAAWLWWKRTR
jgi:uncharacterized PurR-regulated membrane protein YhhQ (DUF165 family)|tara:strand:- start:9972 stop:10484 length:513 start_codon:yes stop_codon:yes gene_type:complete